jgi:deazaflavin-dependent oxidoreductase (nitroreductase family)
VTTARRLARFNRVVTNRIQGTWAWLIPPWVVIVNQGRTSGRSYRTPALGSIHHNGHETHLAVGLPYGDDADWVRNVMAAGGGKVVRSGRKRILSDPRIVDRSDRNAVPGRARWSIVPSRKVLVGTLHGQRSAS